MGADHDWGLDISDLSSHIERLSETMRETANLMRDGSSLPPCLDSSLAELDRVRALTAKIRERLDVGPLCLLLEGRFLSREQYYLLVARRILRIGVSESEPYDEFRMFHYEDDEQMCYINSDERLPEGRVGVQFGSPPEDILWNRLRLEQQEYFKEHRPDVAARFRRDA